MLHIYITGPWYMYVQLYSCIYCGRDLAEWLERLAVNHWTHNLILYIYTYCSINMLPMPKSQQSWVRSQPPPTHWYRRQREKICRELSFFTIHCHWFVKCTLSLSSIEWLILNKPPHWCHLYYNTITTRQQTLAGWNPLSPLHVFLLFLWKVASCLRLITSKALRAYTIRLELKIF